MGGIFAAAHGEIGFAAAASSEFSAAPTQRDEFTGPATSHPATNTHTLRFSQSAIKIAPSPSVDANPSYILQRKVK